MPHVTLEHFGRRSARYISDAVARVGRLIRQLPAGTGVLLCLVVAVCAVTAAQRAHLLTLSELAASPHGVAEGRLWQLGTSALVVQSPLAWSVLGFVTLGLLCLWRCGDRLLWLSGATGHVASTLLAYGLLAAIRLFEPHAFQRTLTAPDYGVSAISAAWLGAVACVLWRARGRSRGGKASIAGACIAVAIFAWMLRRGLNILDLEHLAAFGFGISLALLTPKLTRAKSRLRIATV